MAAAALLALPQIGADAARTSALAVEVVGALRQALDQAFAPAERKMVSVTLRYNAFFGSAVCFITGVS